MKKYSLFSFLIIFSALFLSQCKKNSFTTDPGKKLSFSTDTIRFDTVFSRQGSATRVFLINNPHNQPLKINSISLQGTNADYYQLNVDGAAGKSFTDIEILAKDSIYVFVEVNIDPNNRTSPLIIDADIVFEYNGNNKKVYLESIGQDVIVFRPERRFRFPSFNYSFIFDHPNESSDTKQVINGETVFTWTNQGKPYLIFDYLVIDSLQRLYIEQGCKVYFHNSSGLWAYRGATLKVRGTKNNPVQFKGDCLDKDFLNAPGQWDRIWLSDGSDEHEINYAIIKNAFIGIQTDPFVLYDTASKLEAKRTLRLSNTIIQNCSGYGLLHRLFKVIGHNNAIMNCGEGLVNISLGGNYQYFHSTFANYYTTDNKRQEPSLVISNRNGVDIDSAYFGNCIIAGNRDEEIKIDSAGNNKMDYKFDHCLLRTKFTNITSAYHFENNIGVIDPGIILSATPTSNDVRLNANSQAITNGKISIAQRFPVDLDAKNRFNAVVKPDIGAYQK
jgi:hypothetical protein